MTINKNYFNLSAEKDIPVLYFLWRVKVASTAAIHLRFSQEYNWRDNSTYKRLLKLKYKGLINTRSDETGAFKVWALTSKGFKAIGSRLFPLKEEGYASENPGHDLYVLAAHYGEWITKGAAKDVRIVTEQELRRIENNELPVWAQQLQTHKPDGVWHFPETKDKKIIALEVELSRKRQSDYVSLGEFYNETKSVSSVLWIVQSSGHAESIRNTFAGKTNLFRDIHNFVTLNDFKKNGWASNIFMGPSENQTIYYFLESCRRPQPVPFSSLMRPLSLTQTILDFRIKCFKSTTSALNENLDIL